MAPVSYYFGVDLYKILVIHRLCVNHMGDLLRRVRGSIESNPYTRTTFPTYMITHFILFVFISCYSHLMIHHPMVLLNVIDI